MIENTQRDLNIALINELGLDLQPARDRYRGGVPAAGCQLEFTPIPPGLVGGHCISVDPYYLTHKAEAIGYHPAVILAGRRINDDMGSYVSAQVIRA